MPQLTPFFREAGAGPGVVCLHANAASSSQWRALMDRLAPRFHVLAADAYGTGGSPPWPTDRPVRLRDEAALLEPVFARAGESFALVGHSYGAAVALVAALAQPHRVRALALYEPTPFSLLDAESPPPNAADGIRATVAGAAAALDAGDPAGPAERFIDFWMGAGTWARMPDARKGPIVASIVNLPGWGVPSPIRTSSTRRSSASSNGADPPRERPRGTPDDRAHDGAAPRRARPADPVRRLRRDGPGRRPDPPPRAPGCGTRGTRAILDAGVGRRRCRARLDRPCRSRRRASFAT